MNTVPTELQLADLKTKLARLSLDGAQRAHLNAILKIAGDISEFVKPGQPLAFSEDFEAAFTPEKAKLIREYFLAASSVAADSIAKGNSPFAAPQAHPASIAK